jgi:DNA-binding transcriptional LysR family regulator
VRPSIRGIEIFVRVVESGSFVAAARSLLIDPAAVTRAIKSLEENLAIALFTRSTRALKLTTEGARFYRAGAPMLRRFEETINRSGRIRRCTDSSRSVWGRPFHVGCCCGPSRRFKKLYPEIRLILFSINDPAQVGDEGIDILIRPGSQRQRGGEHRAAQSVVVRKLTQSPIVICASPEYLHVAGTPATPVDLTQHACMGLLTLERDVQEEWRFAKANLREKVKTDPKLIADGEALREAGLAGCGIIRVLACNIDDELRTASLVRILPNWDAGSLPIVAVYRKSRLTLPRITAFVRHVAHEFRRYDADGIPRS